jgi:spore coat protein U-like protein
MAFPLLAAPAQAQLLSVCLGVTITVSPLSFSYTPANTAQNSTNVKFSCSILGLSVLPDITASLNGGNNNSFPRKMSPSSGSDRLQYNIYTTSGYGTVWGDGTNGTQKQFVSGQLIGANNYTFTAWGMVPSGQYVKATSYTDQITVSVTF